MASLVKRPRSPFWYIVCHSVQSDGSRKWTRKATQLRWDSPSDTDEAKLLLAHFDFREATHRPKDVNESNWNWVPDFFSRHPISTATMKRYLSIWRQVLIFLNEEKLTPSTIRYRHAIAYYEWRKNQHKKNGTHISKNTARLEIKILSLVLNEAVRMEIVPGNPLLRMRLARESPPTKPALTDRQIHLIREELKNKPEWMQMTFEIAAGLGVRLSETRIPRECVNLKNGTVTIPSPKGGEEKAFTTLIPEHLSPLFKKFMKSGKPVTVTFPAGDKTYAASRAFGRLFKKLGMKKEGVTFHCLRVTKATRLWEQGVPKEIAMRLLNHSSELVAEQYVRHSTEPLLPYRDKAKI